MTENEAKALKWMKNIRDDAVVTLDYIQKNEPNVSPLLYAGRKQKAETIIVGLEELETYRAIGTVEKFKILIEKNEPQMVYVFGDGYADGRLVYDTYQCPNCEKTYELEYEEYEFCPNCGQHLKIDLKGAE